MESQSHAPAPERSLRLNQVTVPIIDLARSIEFYRGLGLLLIVRDESAGYARFLLPDGGSTFSVHLTDRPIAPSQVVIYFECDDHASRPPPRPAEVGRRVAKPDPACHDGNVRAFTTPFNVSGQPTITLPWSTSSGGLPIGVHRVARAGADRLLLAVEARLV